jgi:hypothetical protein
MPNWSSQESWTEIDHKNGFTAHNMLPKQQICIRLQYLCVAIYLLQVESESIVTASEIKEH